MNHRVEYLVNQVHLEFGSARIKVAVRSSAHSTLSQSIYQVLFQTENVHSK